MKRESPEEQRKQMLEAPIPGLIGRLAVPTIISMLVTSIYNMADTYFVSHIGAGDGATSASGAVSIVFSLMAIIQAVGFTVGMGAGSITSRLLGKGWKERADQYASSAVILGLVLGLLLMSVCFVWIDELVWLLGATPTIYPYALDYARYIIFGAPVMILAYILNNLLRWQGKANRSVIGLGFGGLLNIVLDPILIFTFDMGISGAAIATLFSQCVSLAILASFFVRGQSDIRVSPRLIAREAKVYGDILKSGLPSFLRQGMSSVASVSLNLNAGLYGDPAVAAMGIVTKVFTFIMSVVIGFGQGFQPVVGFNYGAGRLDRVRESVKFSMKSCTLVLTAAAVIGFLFAPQVIHFFREDTEVIAIGARAFRFQCVSLPLGAVLVFANMLFQSLGCSWRASFLAVCRQGLFFIPLIFLLPRLFDLTGLEMTQMVADFITFLCSGGMLLHFFRTGLAREGEKSPAPAERKM